MKVDDIDFSAKIPEGGYDVEPALNLKCILMTLYLAAAYWFLPANNKYVLLGLLFFPYLWISYYDVFFDARRNMGPTYLANYYDWLKIQDSKQIKVWKNWSPKWKRRVLLVDFIILLALIPTLYFFMKWKPKPKNVDEEDANRRAFAFLGFSLSVCIFIRLFYKP